MHICLKPFLRVRSSHGEKLTRLPFRNVFKLISFRISRALYVGVKPYSIRTQSMFRQAFDVFLL